MKEADRNDRGKERRIQKKKDRVRETERERENKKEIEKTQ